MTRIYIVRSGAGYQQPESYILGLYPTLELARARIQFVTGDDEEFDPDETWIDEVEVGARGADCLLCNR